METQQPKQDNTVLYIALAVIGGVLILCMCAFFCYFTLVISSLGMYNSSKSFDIQTGSAEVTPVISEGNLDFENDFSDLDLSDDPFKGNSSAKVTIVEYGDFQCPFCGQYYRETFPQLKKDYIDTGKVKYVYKNYPLSFHENAQKAAEAGECAYQQDGFWEYHDMLLANQNRLSEVDLKFYAGEVGLDIVEFNQCLTNGETKSAVSQDLADGQSAGVTGTPNFSINGRKLEGAQPYSEFKKVIEEELNK